MTDLFPTQPLTPRYGFDNGEEASELVRSDKFTSEKSNMPEFVLFEQQIVDVPVKVRQEWKLMQSRLKGALRYVYAQLCEFVCPRQT